MILLWYNNKEVNIMFFIMSIVCYGSLLGGVFMAGYMVRELQNWGDEDE